MSEYFCQEHGVVFFKKGRMKGYAHPIDNTDQWCNMPEGQDPMTEAEQEKVKPQETSFKADPIKTSSIERQSALKSSVAWCGLKLQGGQDLKTVDVITCAVMFESYLKNGAVVTKK